MDRQQHRAELIKFLRDIRRRYCPIEEIGDNRSLVESELVDSLAALQIAVYSEQTYKIDFRDHAIDLGDLSSMGMIRDIIERSTAS